MPVFRCAPFQAPLSGALPTVLNSLGSNESNEVLQAEHKELSHEVNGAGSFCELSDDGGDNVDVKVSLGSSD